jgi:hypothetical protein
MNRLCGVTGAVLIGLGVGGCETMKQLAEASGRTKVSMTLKNGQKIEGTLLSDQDGHSVVQVGYGSVTVTTGEVASVEKTGTVPAPGPGDGRLSRWDHCLHVVAAGGSQALTQVPATVIDLGILKNVPYLSHRRGDVELNIYGDPERPACLEIGLYRGGMSLAERKACLDTICRLLGDPADREAVRSLGLEKGRLHRQGMAFEVTPPTDKDAYGGWWITVYDEKALSQQRATDAELAAITVTPAQIKGAARAPLASTGHPPAPPAANPLHWKEHDLKSARSAPPTAQEPRVYKRGVYRHDGAYVVWTP